MMVAAFGILGQAGRIMAPPALSPTSVACP
jgi:hypothetical protein